VPRSFALFVNEWESATIIRYLGESVERKRPMDSLPFEHRRLACNILNAFGSRCEPWVPRTKTPRSGLQLDFISCDKGHVKQNPRRSQNQAGTAAPKRAISGIRVTFVLRGAFSSPPESLPESKLSGPAPDSGAANAARRAAPASVFENLSEARIVPGDR
jgi:hypothetical protein